MNTSDGRLTPTGRTVKSGACVGSRYQAQASAISAAKNQSDPQKGPNLGSSPFSAGRLNACPPSASGGTSRSVFGRRSSRRRDMDTKHDTTQGGGRCD